MAEIHNNRTKAGAGSHYQSTVQLGEQSIAAFFNRSSQFANSIVEFSRDFTAGLIKSAKETFTVAGRELRNAMLYTVGASVISAQKLAEAGSATAGAIAKTPEALEAARKAFAANLDAAKSSVREYYSASKKAVNDSIHAFAEARIGRQEAKLRGSLTERKSRYHEMAGFVKDRIHNSSLSSEDKVVALQAFREINDQIRSEVSALKADFIAKQADGIKISKKEELKACISLQEKLIRQSKSFIKSLEKDNRKMKWEQDACRETLRSIRERIENSTLSQATKTREQANLKTLTAEARIQAEAQVSQSSSRPVGVFERNALFYRIYKEKLRTIAKETGGQLGNAEKSLPKGLRQVLSIRNEIDKALEGARLSKQARRREKSRIRKLMKDARAEAREEAEEKNLKSALARRILVNKLFREKLLQIQSASKKRLHDLEKEKKQTIAHHMEARKLRQKAAALRARLEAKEAAILKKAEARIAAIEKQRKGLDQKVEKIQLQKEALLAKSLNGALKPQKGGENALAEKQEAKAKQAEDVKTNVPA